MKYNINLIGEEKTSFLDKALYFFLNYLRYILVVTQLVVIGVLFYRFSIDQKIIDLKDSIEQKKEIINVVSPIIEEAGKIDRQVGLIKNITNVQSAFVDQLQYIFSIFPQTVLATEINVNKDQIKILGNSNNLKDLQLFYLKLKQDNKFSSVNLEDIRRDPSGYGFTLDIKGFKK